MRVSIHKYLWYGEGGREAPTDGQRRTDAPTEGRADGTDEQLTFFDGYSDAWVCHLLYIRVSYTQAVVDGEWVYLDPRNPGVR